MEEREGRNLDCETIKRSIEVLKQGKLFEIRVIKPSAKWQLSGYFKDAETAVAQLKRTNLKDSNVYMVLNDIDEACYSRPQKDELQQYVKASTSDRDIVHREWILLDFDPVRPKETSASDEQLQKAKSVCGKTKVYLRSCGFKEPIIGFSGNGFHLLYKIDMPNNKESEELLKGFLQTMSEIFSDGEIKIDAVNFNASRVCKLYGTKAQKGKSTEERPHRMSQLLQVPETVEVTETEKFKQFLPKVEEPQRKHEEFDLETWMNTHGISYKARSGGDFVKYVLDECPFDSNHKAPDSAIIRRNNGTICFHCFHDSCSDKSWRDVREKYEPDAYTKMEYRQQNNYQGSYQNYQKPKPTPKITPKEGKPVFYTAKEIINLPKLKEDFIPTGIFEIDKRIRGLKKDYTSVWSGLRASAKSTLLSQVALETLKNGGKVLLYSGEMAERNLMRWMMQQAAGADCVQETEYEGYYTVKRETQEAIATWMGDRFRLYNNEYGNDFRAVADQLRNEVIKTKADLLILDNLMSFNLRNLSDDKYEAQTKFVWELHKMANELHIHIAFVAHPRKSLGFLRFDDIAGTADLGNAVEYAFIVHRNNDDFQRLYGAMYGKVRVDNLEKTATNFVEIVKDRDGGTQDVLVPLYYEKETKRLKNDATEHKLYGWENQRHYEETPFD